MTTDKQIPKLQNWIPLNNGHYYTNRLDIIKNRFNIQKPEIVHHLNSYVTDTYGDKIYVTPIYLLTNSEVKIRKYYNVEVYKLKLNEQIRVIRINKTTDIEFFGIEQILFKNIPTNTNLIPVLLKPLECIEYYKLKNLENCLLLFWKCIVCDLKSDHWSKINIHNCKEDKSTTEHKEDKSITKPKSKRRKINHDQSVDTNFSNQYNCHKNAFIEVSNNHYNSGTKKFNGSYCVTRFNNNLVSI